MPHAECTMYIVHCTYNLIPVIKSSKLFADVLFKCLHFPQCRAIWFILRHRKQFYYTIIILIMTFICLCKIDKKKSIKKCKKNHKLIARARRNKTDMYFMHSL